LLRAELHTLATGKARVRRAVHADGLTFALREMRWELYPLKDRLGDQRGGSEWEPIKILLGGD
jgi:hypothetical protein